MNAYDDSPFFFFVDNPNFPIDVYPDFGKIIELSDTGCDARAPLTSTRRRNDQSRPYSAKTLYADVLSFQDVFDDKEKQKDSDIDEISDQKTKKVPTRDRTVPRSSKRSRTMEQENNEKVDQWERNIADFKNALLRDQVNLLGDSSVENILDYDPISENSKTYFSNSRNSIPKREINRKSRKEEMNVKNEIRERIPDFTKKSNESKTSPGFSRDETSKGKAMASESRSTRVDRKKRRDNYEKNNNEKRNERTRDFSEEPRSIDRGVDKDSLSDCSGMSDNIVTKMNDNRNSLPKEEGSSSNTRSKTLPNKNIKNRETFEKKRNSSLDKRSKILSNENIEADKDYSRERKDVNSRQTSEERTKGRVKSQTRTVSKSADFDKAKHRANMAKRYANKAWMQKRQNTFTNAKTEETEISDNSKTKNIDYVQKKAVSKSAGSSTRKREDTQTGKIESEEINIELSFDDNADSSKRTTKTVNEYTSTNRIRNIAVPANESFRQEEENNSERQSISQGGIQRKDLEKLSAIFLSSTLKRNLNRNERQPRKERNKSVPTNGNRMEETRLDRISSSRISNETTSKIRLSVSNLSKLPSKTEKWVKSKIPVAISRLKKELEEPRVTENRDFGESPLREQSLKTKSTMRDNEILSKNDRINESTSIGIIPVDKSDCRNNESNDRSEIRSRLDEWSKKLEETRRRERDVELKVFKMAKAQKEERKKEFEKRGFRESVKKSKNDGKKNMVDIAANMLEKESIGKKSQRVSNSKDTRDVIENDYNIRKEAQPKSYSLRSSMYSRYFPTAL